MNNIFGNSIPLQQASLDFLWNKMQVHMHNISNVDTPGYKTKFITFEDEFKSRLTKAYKMSAKMDDYAKIIGEQNFTIHYTDNQSARLDENNVDMDTEQIEVARTSYHYNFLLRSINSDISRFRSAIKVG